MHVVSLGESLFQSVRVAATTADGAVVLNLRKKSPGVWAAAADAPSERHEQIGATTRNRVSTGVFSYLVRKIMSRAQDHVTGIMTRRHPIFLQGLVPVLASMPTAVTPAEAPRYHL